MKQVITRILTSFFATALLITSTAAMAGNSRAIRADYPLTRLSDRVYVLYGPLSEPNKENQGFRNNVVVVLTTAGVVVMDVGTSVYAGNMVLKKIRGISDKPVVAVFNSHVHGDHWLGNQAFKEANPKVNIYAHARMIDQARAGEGTRWIERFNAATDNAVVGTRPVIPNIAVRDGQVITVGDVRFRVHHTGIAHSDGDIMIEIPQEKMLFTGDVVRAGTVSISSGSFKGNIVAIDRLLGTKAKTFIPGHGMAGGREIVQAYRRFIDTLRSVVARHYESGLPDYQIKPYVVKALAEFHDWARFDEHIGRLVSLAYLEVQDEAFN